jgi:hypothetical protein
MVIQNVFSDPKMAAVIGFFIVFVPVSIALLAVMTVSSTGHANNWAQYLYMFPSFPYAIVVTDLFLGSDGPIDVSFFF